MSAPDRRARLDRKHGVLSIRRQCKLLSVARSGLYRPPIPANDNDLSVQIRARYDANNLYVAVHVTPHSLLRRDGTEIYFDLQMSIVQAALGGDVGLLGALALVATELKLHPADQVKTC